VEFVNKVSFELVKKEADEYVSYIDGSAMQALLGVQRQIPRPWIARPKQGLTA
jgi:hypothetical protein